MISSQKIRHKANGVPVLSKSEISRLTESILSEHMPNRLAEPDQVDVDTLAFINFGLKQDFQLLSHAGIYLGMYLFSSTDYLPVYNAETKTAEYTSAQAGTIIIDSSLLKDEFDHRYRFTVAHELAHAVLHDLYHEKRRRQISIESYMSGDSSGKMIQCRMNMAGREVKPVSKWTDADFLEWQANYFASTLLMPEPAVRKLLGKNPGDKPLVGWEQVVAERKTMIYFRVSNTAANIRLHDLNITTGSRPNPFDMKQLF